MHYFWKKLHVLLRTGLGGASTHFVYSHLKTRFKRDLDQNMFENALFFEKNWKNRRAVGAPFLTPRWPLAALETLPPDLRVVTPSLCLP